MSLLVDPLAALFRHELSKVEPLVLDATEVEAELLPPLARVAITRRFSNTSCSLLEAVLTLPPTAQHEVVYGLIVTINGAAYHARARRRTDASSAHNAAITEGRRAILHELIADVAQLVSIAGIEAAAQVAVRIESIRPLNCPDDDLATLHISLTAEPRRVNRHLSDGRFAGDRAQDPRRDADRSRRKLEGHAERPATPDLAGRVLSDRLSGNDHSSYHRARRQEPRSQRLPRRIARRLGSVFAAQRRRSFSTDAAERKRDEQPDRLDVRAHGHRRQENTDYRAHAGSRRRGAFIQRAGDGGLRRRSIGRRRPTS